MTHVKQNKAQEKINILIEAIYENMSEYSAVLLLQTHWDLKGNNCKLDVAKCDTEITPTTIKHVINGLESERKDLMRKLGAMLFNFADNRGKVLALNAFNPTMASMSNSKLVNWDSGEE